MRCELIRKVTEPAMMLFGARRRLRNRGQIDCRLMSSLLLAPNVGSDAAPARDQGNRRLALGKVQDDLIQPMLDIAGDLQDFL
jgi:hypothetical protein